jgi:hypothetical protein
VLMLRTTDVAHHLLNHQWTSQLMDHFSSPIDWTCWIPKAFDHWYICVVTIERSQYLEFPSIYLIMVHLRFHHGKEPISWVPRNLMIQKELMPMSVNHLCADCHLYIDPFAKMQKTQGKIPSSNLYTHVP